MCACRGPGASRTCRWRCRTGRCLRAGAAVDRPGPRRDLTPRAPLQGLRDVGCRQGRAELPGDDVASALSLPADGRNGVQQLRSRSSGVRGEAEADIVGGEVLVVVLEPRPRTELLGPGPLSTNAWRAGIISIRAPLGVSAWSSDETRLEVTAKFDFGSLTRHLSALVRRGLTASASIVLLLLTMASSSIHHNPRSNSIPAPHDASFTSLRPVPQVYEEWGPHPMTPKQLFKCIRILPEDAPITTALEQSLLRSDGEVQPSGGYASQQQHWLSWLRDYDGPGYYGRKSWERTAAFVYNHIVCPPMVLWLCEASGVPRPILEKAALEAHVANKTMTPLFGEWCHGPLTTLSRPSVGIFVPA